LVHVQSSMKPIVGRDSPFGCNGTITIIVHTSKGMNYAPFALRLSIVDEKVVGVREIGARRKKTRG